MRLSVCLSFYQYTDRQRCTEGLPYSSTSLMLSVESLPGATLHSRPGLDVQCLPSQVYQLLPDSTDHKLLPAVGANLPGHIPEDHRACQDIDNTGELYVLIGTDRQSPSSIFPLSFSRPTTMPSQFSIRTKRRFRHDSVSLA